MATTDNSLSSADRNTESTIEFIRKVRARIGSVVVGQDDVVERMLIALFTGGHLLLQGVPGLAPTIEALRLELLAPPPLASANWAGYRELLARPGVLEAATAEELRAVVLELVDQLVYVGDPNRIKVRLRSGASGNPT